MTPACVFAGGAYQADSCIDPAVVKFVVAAKEFCWLLESEVALTEPDLTQQLLIAILALFATSLALPEVDPELDSGEEPFFDQNSRQVLR